MRGPEAQSRERRWGEVQTQGLVWGLQCPEAQFYIKTKVIATNFSKLIYKHTQSLQDPKHTVAVALQCCVWCCSCHCHAMRGVPGMVIAPHGCHRCHRRAVHGIMGTIVVPHWCCYCHHCTAHGVTVAVVVPRGCHGRHFCVV